MFSHFHIIIIIIICFSLANCLTRNHLATQRLLSSAVAGPSLNEIPCSKSELKFPPDFDAALLLPSNVNAKGIILPINGAFILQDSSQIQLFSNDDARCQGQSNLPSQIVQPKHLHWFDPKSWINTTLDRFRSMPDIEKIPCSGDKISLPVRSALSVDLENVRSLNIGEIVVEGHELSANDFQALLQSELGSMIFRSSEGTRVQTGTAAVCGCHHVENSVEYEYRVCSHQKQSCSIPTCFDPIVPLGSCCASCGAILKLYVDDCNKFDEASFSNIVQNLTVQMELENRIQGYGSLIQEGDEKFYQYIMLDSEVYSEKSVQFAQTLKEKFASRKYDLIYSGRFYSPTSKTSPWTIIIVTFLIAAAFFIVLYAHYERNIGTTLPLPAWLVNSRQRVFRSPFVFARFENHPADTDVDVAGNVEVGLTEGNERILDRDANDVVVRQDSSAVGATTSFHNPMFCEEETKSAAMMGSSIPAASLQVSVAKHDKKSVRTIPEFRIEEIIDKDDDEEELVEVDLGLEINSE